MRPICSVTLARFLGAGVCLLAGALSASAHHSVEGVFDAKKDMIVTGTISKLEWINPHIFVWLDVQDPNGLVSQYSFETLPPAMLRRAGVTKEALLGGNDVGQVVTVQANPARQNPRGGWITRITYSDGHFYQLSAVTQ